MLAPADGTVIFASNRGAYGKTLVVDHGYGVQTHYSHLSAFEAKWGQAYPMAAKSWRDRWQNVIPLFCYPAPIRKVIYTTNAIESLHSQVRKTIRNKGQNFEPECLSCHTTGYQHKNGYSDQAPYNRLSGVQCEACHGYGTEHARDGRWRAQAKDSCTTCHDEENSPNFDYATYWEKIKH